MRLMTELDSILYSIFEFSSACAFSKFCALVNLGDGSKLFARAMFLALMKFYLSINLQYLNLGLV